MNWFQWAAPSGVLALISVVTLRVTIQKIRAEAGKLTVDAAVAEDTADDAHWRGIVEAQTEALIKPLREELATLRGEVRDLKDQVDHITHRYRSAIGYIRLLLSLLRQHHGPGMETPTPPSEIAGDI